LTRIYKNVILDTDFRLESFCFLLSFSFLRAVLNKLRKYILLFLGLIVSLNAPQKIFAQQPNACATASTGADPSATVCISRDIIVFDGTSIDNRFYVSWVSAQTESGQVQIIGGATYSDTCAECYSGVTHYIRVDNLQPNTTYLFDIVSGGNTYTNNDAHWSINTGPAQASRNPDTIIGRVKNPNGSDAVGALVYVSIRNSDTAGTNGTSALLSQVITSDDGGFFHIDLAQARSADHASLFAYSASGDKLLIRAVGSSGTASTNVDSGRPRPGQPTLILTLGSNGGTVATATPSVPPPTPTSTLPSPTPTRTATVTATPVTATATLTNPPPSATARPRPTRTPFVEPPETAQPSPGITIAPAAETAAAEATVASTVPNPETETTRVAFRGTPTPNANSSGGGFFVDNSLVVLAIIAFGGAALLGVAAFFMWRK
jgi:hypothetical protein